MSVLAECLCHKKQSLKNKVCSVCGANLDKLKRQGKLSYWIVYRLPGGKQKSEKMVGKKAHSIEEARAADGKRRGQKRENRIFDVLPEAKMTFNKLRDWYLGLEKTKALGNYSTLKTLLKKFCSEFGEQIVNTIKPSELENLQMKRKSEGMALATIDYELNVAKMMVNKAFKNNLLGGETLKIFKGIKPMMPNKNANARNKILSPQQFYQILEKMPYPGRGPLLMAFMTGMREGEILNLAWSRVNLEKHMVELQASDTKDKEPRTILLFGDLLEMLKRTPRGLHDPHVFLWKGKKIDPKQFRLWVKQACTDAKILYGRFVKDGFVPHDLRHGFVTYMRRAGVDKSVIMKLTGHSTDSMFDRYNEVDGDEQKQAMTRYDDFLRKEIAKVDQSVDQKS